MNAGMRIGSLFAGIGGLERGLEMAGVGHTVFQVEKDPYCRRVLEKHWPDATRYDDVTTVDWEEMNAMAGRRNDLKAEMMYDRYCQGLSLAEVAEEFECTRQSVWQMFSNRNWDMRQRPPARPTLEWGGRSYSLRDSGYYGASDGDRELLHRAVWKHAHPTKPLPDDWDVHHKDHDKTNNDPGNLEAMPKSAHTAHHHAVKGVMPNEEPAVDVICGGFP